MSDNTDDLKHIRDAAIAKNNDLQQIYDSVDELMDLIIEVVGYSLPEDHRRFNESGEDAFAREILQPLNDVQGTIMDLTIEEH
jgi:hypothetical protein